MHVSCCLLPAAVFAALGSLRLRLVYISFRMVGALKVRGHLESQAHQKVTRAVHSDLSEQCPMWPYRPERCI